MVCILIHVRLLEFPLEIFVFLLENFLFHFQGNGILRSYCFAVSDNAFNFTSCRENKPLCSWKKKIGRKAEYVKDSCLSLLGRFPNWSVSVLFCLWLTSEDQS